MHQHLICALDDAALQRLLYEDAPHGDLTTRALGLRGQHGTMSFLARAPMRVAATEEAARLITLAGADSVRVLAASGAQVEGAAMLLRAEGSAQSLLLSWKVAQTLVEALSGIATATAQIVASVRDAGFALPLACTRKNLPGTRALSAKAVLAGGGVMHRLGLSETVLVFPEHRNFLNTTEWPQALAALRTGLPEKKTVVEVGSEDDAIAVARLGVDVLQLERFSPEALRALRLRLQSEGLTPLLAPAGGVTLANALDYARAGADLLVSSAPYFAPPADVKVVIEGTPRAS